MTKRDYFNAIKALNDVKANPDFVAFIDREIAALDKKNASRKNAMSPALKANMPLFNDFRDFMVKAGAPVTVAQIRTQFNLSSQKAVGVLKQMAESGLITKEVVKKISYYSVVTEG